MLPEGGCLLPSIIEPQKSCVIQKICRDEDKLTNMTPEEVISFYTGIAPQEWLENAIEGSENIKKISNRPLQCMPLNEMPKRHFDGW